MNNLDIHELKKLYLEFNYPNVFKYKNLIELYVNKKMSLPDIKYIES